MMKNIKFWLLSLFSGLLLAISWPEIVDFTSLIFLAFVPLLVVEDQLAKTKEKPGSAVFSYAYLSFFIFNLISTWWIYFASDWGAAAAIICNSFFMATVFWLFHQTKQKVGRKEGYIGLLIYWLAFEYLHLNWDLSWPWLTLGNVFANEPDNVQWYEYTGILGGSLWVLVANLAFFSFVGKLQLSRTKAIIGALVWLLWVFVPSFFSESVYSTYKAEGKELEVVIIQPNIDPYLDKFGGMSESDQIDRMVTLAKQEVGPETDLLVLPETAFPSFYWEHNVEHLYGTVELRKLIKQNPQLRVVVGLTSRALILDEDKVTPTARKLDGGIGYYDNYNAAMQLDETPHIPFHRKSKLVLGVEKLPFLEYLPFMKKLSINLGGSAGGYGWQDHPSVFFNQDSAQGLGPIICYESIYGEYVNQYARSGAELYAIITNDGWWEDTPGYKQHLAYARLRAIEGRRSIVRSANTGISAIINQKGEIVSETKWWEQAALKGKVSLNDRLTFYVKYGNYLGRIASFVAPLLLLLTLVKRLNKTGQRLSLKKP
ncbi:MAG: apolipoprotein N-acyltransferase [Vicingaceae bacterium]